MIGVTICTQRYIICVNKYQNVLWLETLSLSLGMFNNKTNTMKREINKLSYNELTEARYAIYDSIITLTHTFCHVPPKDMGKTS